VLAIGYALVPVNAETARRGVRNGFGPAVSVQLGALEGDVPWARLSLTGVALVLQGRPLSTALGLVGAAFLALLAQSAFRSTLSREPIPTFVHDGNGWRVGFVMSGANPGGFAFWTGVGGGALATSQERGPAADWLLVVSYTLASALAGTLLAVEASKGQRWRGGQSCPGSTAFAAWSSR